MIREELHTLAGRRGYQAQASRASAERGGMKHREHRLTGGGEFDFT